MAETSNNIFNIILGSLSVLAIISGFLIEKYQILFWSIGSALLIVVVLSYYVFDNRNKIIFLSNKFKKIEESLNIYNRLNKIEIELGKMRKNGQINLMDIIKIGLAILLIWVFVQAISSLIK